MKLQKLGKFIIKASIAIYNILEEDIELTAELKDGRTIKIEITMDTQD